MRKRIREKRDKKLFREKLKNLGLKFKIEAENSSSIRFHIPSLPDFTWGIWIWDKELVYFGQFTVFCDKFKPSAVDYCFYTFQEFYDFLHSFDDNYKKRVVELVRKGNADYNWSYYMSEEDRAKQSDEEIWANFSENSKKAKFEDDHFGLTEEEWEEAEKEKFESLDKLKNFPYVSEVIYRQNRGKRFDSRIFFRTGRFIVLADSEISQEEKNKIFDILENLRYNSIGRPELYVGEKGSSLMWDKKFKKANLLYKRR